jgi:predicted glutamine amidotransferase
MCRFLAYIGEPVFLNSLVCEPAHSLLHQSLQAERAKTATNGDGFGIGWYGEREAPAVYREVMPAWSDENLLALCHTLRSPLFFAHVRAATGTAIARQNSHPFCHSRWMFMHNGQIGGYAQVRRTLEARLPDELYAARKGATDSELLFLLALTEARSGLPITEAVTKVFEDTTALLHERGIDQPLRFSAALADGKHLHVFRLASDDEPPSLYVQRGRRGTAVASEPLDDAGHWQLLPTGSVVSFDRVGRQIEEPALA